MNNLAFIVLLACDWKVFISFSIYWNLKCEVNLGIQKHCGLKLKEIVAQPVVI